MSSVIQMSFMPASNREIVAAEVRAELARRKIPIARVHEYVGGNRDYWRRRIGTLEMDFTVGDLVMLSQLFDVPVEYLIRGAKKPLVVEDQRLSLPDMDSNHEPTH